jgi:hypothetical protein
MLLSINTEFDLELRQFFVSISGFMTVLDCSTVHVHVIELTLLASSGGWMKLSFCTLAYCTDVQMISIQKE